MNRNINKRLEKSRELLKKKYREKTKLPVKIKDSERIEKLTVVPRGLEECVDCIIF